MGVPSDKDESQSVDSDAKFSEWLLATASARLKKIQITCVVVPARCHIETVSWGCSFHVVELQTGGIDLDKINGLQMFHEPLVHQGASGQESPQKFGFSVGLHVSDKPQVRIVFAYICSACDLLVPLTRWVVRSPRKTSLTFLAPPRAAANDKPAQTLIWPGDPAELAVDFADSIEHADGETDHQIPRVFIDDAQLAKRLHQGVERLWYAELQKRQTDSKFRRTKVGFGQRCMSIHFSHRVGAGMRVVPNSFSMLGVRTFHASGSSNSSTPAVIPVNGKLRKYDDHFMVLNSWDQLESQLSHLATVACLPVVPSSKNKQEGGSSKKKRTKLRGRQHAAKLKSNEPRIHQDDGKNQPRAVVADGDNRDDDGDSQQENLDGASVGDAESDRGTPGRSDTPELNAEIREDKPDSVNNDEDGDTLGRPDTPDPNANSDDDVSFEPSIGSSEPLRPSIRKPRTIGDLKSATSKSWADMSEAEDDEYEPFVWETPVALKEVVDVLGADCVDKSWAEIEGALQALPSKVSDAIAGTINDATGVEAYLPERNVDAPLQQRRWSSVSEHSGEFPGMFGCQPWFPEEAELGQWYEIHTADVRQICGIILAGSSGHNCWVEVLKLRIKYFEGGWEDVMGGNLFTACSEASAVVTVPLDVKNVEVVRIYPVVWHGAMGLHADLVAPACQLSLQAETTAAFRDGASSVYASMMSTELGGLLDISQSISRERRSSVGMANLVHNLYRLPGRVAQIARKPENNVLHAWKESARKDAAMKDSRPWVDAIPDDLPLVVASRAQAAAMDQVSKALGILEELQQFTASSIADRVLRSKALKAGSASEKDKLHRAFGRNRHASMSMNGSSITLEPVRECDEALFNSDLDLDDSQRLDVLWEGETNAESTEARMSAKLSAALYNKTPDFWLDIFAEHFSFRLGGGIDCWIYDIDHEFPDPVFKYSVHNQADHEMVAQGSFHVQDIVRIQGLDGNKSFFVSINCARWVLCAPLAPLRSLTNWGVLHSRREMSAVFALAGQGSRTCQALSRANSEVLLAKGGQGWAHECQHRQWKIRARGTGYVIESNETQKNGTIVKMELAMEQQRLILNQVGCVWNFHPVRKPSEAGTKFGMAEFAVYLVTGGRSVNVDGADDITVTEDQNLWAEWVIFQQTHCEISPESLIRLPPDNPDCETGGVFRAAGDWRRARTPIT